MRNLSILAVLISCMYSVSLAVPQFFEGNWHSDTGTTSQDGEVSTFNVTPSEITITCLTEYACCWEIEAEGIWIYVPDTYATPAPPKGEYPASPLPTTITNSSSNSNNNNNED